MDQNIGVGGQQEARIDASLQQTIDAFVQAFNRYDAAAVASFWAEDGTLLNPVGNYGRGRAGVEKVFREDAQRVLGGATVSIEVRTARPVGSDHVLLDCEQEARNCRMPDGTTGTMRLHLVVLAQRTADGWKWLDARPYRFAPPAPVH
jgi:uncharacterized protein (TIGR02246 family)